MSGRKRKNYHQQSVLAWMLKGESYSEAKRRLDALWAQGKHPSQEQEREIKE